jgi:glycosyltransferase involved in cell wall biosynthesis
MKIVHLNTHSYGGAAVVARRLHCAALESGIQSKFITKYGLRNDPTPGYTALKDARLLYFLRKQSADARLYRLGKHLQRLTQHRNLADRPASYEVFSPLNTDLRFANCADSFTPEVLHLHWIAGFVDHEEFFRANRDKKFVWTLHDMNPLTGGCHHSDGCQRFSADCSACPQLEGTIDVNYANRVLASKLKSLAHLSDEQLTVVAPSRWLLELSQKSRVTSRFRHVMIDNPARPRKLAIEDAAELRADLGLPRDRKIVLFVAENLRNARKGVDLLFTAARHMDRLNQVHFVGVGQRTDVPRDLPVSFTGTITDDQMMARYFSCADVVVSPSMAENAPLVLIESLSTGTPVVAFNVGGVPELVDEACGVVVGQRSTQALAHALERALFERTFSRSDIQERSARFEPGRIMRKYQEVYAELLAS